MNLDRVSRIAEAVLYEGYMLYPYRASAVKNQRRWNFGVLCPRSYSEAQKGTEAWTMQTECLLEADAATELGIRIRFLQIVNRTIGRLAHPLPELPSRPDFETVNRLEIGERTLVPWQEAMECEVTIPPLKLADLLPPLASPLRVSFEFPAARQFEAVHGVDGSIVAVIVREWEAVAGAVEIGCERRGEGLVKLRVGIQNLTANESTPQQLRADALMYSLVSAHTVLVAEKGRFVSLLDPPESLRAQAADCINRGTWPVLVGEEGDRDTMLSSPIILYDYPQIAPESPGSLFDGTEIDEILSLRILTLTEEEKREMRQSDERARQILERTEGMPPEQFMKLHGALRGLRPSPGEVQ